jgi:hypothetical protein
MFAAEFWVRSVRGGDFFSAIKVRGERRKKFLGFGDMARRVLGCGLVAEIKFMRVRFLW